MTLWYLRSMADQDTHRGIESGGNVGAACGTRFAPRPVAFGGEALPGEPPDPDQICPQCLLAGTPGETAALGALPCGLGRGRCSSARTSGARHGR